jgi:SAM-dependent methyltransferase
MLAPPITTIGTWTTRETEIDDDVPSPDPLTASVAAYSAHADTYAETHAAKMLEQVRRFANSLPTPSRILDAGCGPGRDLARFADHGHVPVGVDLNPTFVRMANLHAPTSQCDLRDVDKHFPERSFDGIWAAASLVHLDVPDAEAVLGHFSTLLRPEGRLFLAVRSMGETGWLDEPDGRRWYAVWEPAEIVTSVTAAGFVIDEVLPGPYVEVWATRGP